MLRDLRVTPFLQNEFYYLGFTYFMDPNPQTLAQFDRQTKSISENHSEKLYKIFDTVANWYNNANIETKEIIATE